MKLAVYVDDMQTPFGRMKMCHMLADKIGVNRRWWQSPQKTSGSHYDIALSKRSLALAAGAIAITWRQAWAMNFQRKITGKMGSPHDAVDWMRSHAGKPRSKPAPIGVQGNLFT